MRKKVKSELIPESAPEQKEEGSYVLTYKNLKEIMALMEEQGLNTVSIEYLMQYCGYPIKNLLSEREVFTKDELFTMEELAYLEEVMHLDYSLAVTFGQREKSDIGGGLLRKLDKLNKKK